jgi:SNF2 family DNA or RNA helicase
MAEFDRINGEFVVVTCAFSEKDHFKNGGWKYNYKRRKWVTTETELALPLRQFAIGAAKEHLDNVASLAEAAHGASWAEETNSDFPSPEGLAYIPFQKAGIEYAIERQRTLIADPPGLGKTIQAIGVHNTVKMKNILIVVPASLKINWEREWMKWDVHGLTVGIAHSKPRTKTVEGITERWTEYNWPDTDVVIINYDMMPTFDDQVKSKTWDMMICDEAHLLKTKKALRTICVFGGRRPGNKKMKRKAKVFTPVEATHALFLTGTPILSRPDELWTLIRACDRTGLGRNWEKYVERYCGAYYDGFGYDTSGSTNAEELNRILRERFMVRRDKQSVLKELPDKTRELVIIPPDKLEAIVRKEQSRAETALNAYEATLGIETSNGLIDTIMALTERLGAAMDVQDSDEPDWEKAVKSLSQPDQMLFTELSLAREEVALAKAGATVDHIKGLVDCGEPVIAFAYHKSVVEEIRSRLEAQGVTVGVITGKVSHKKRQQVVDDFQAGKYDVILGNLIAMGVGFTLTRASIVVFAELDWVPAMIEQAEDRAWRIGQKNAVLVQHLVVNGTIESILVQAILEKMGVIKRVLDKAAVAD